jgi:hypothetical protein
MNAVKLFGDFGFHTGGEQGEPVCIMWRSDIPVKLGRPRLRAHWPPVVKRLISDL